MKVIVFQTLLDLGLITDKIFPTGKPDESILIISTCMKSVKSWCRKNGYEYVLCEENLNWNYAHKELSSLGYEDVPEFAYDMCAQRHEYLQRFDADLKIILDNDIWVHINFELPDVKVGICKSSLYSYDSPKKLKRSVMKPVSIAQQLSGSYYPQGGVQFLHKDYCDHYNKWMVEKIKSSYMPLMFGDYEQSYIFEYTRQFPQNITWLNYKYNCVPKRYSDEECRNSYLIHFPGGFKPTPLAYLPDNFKGDEFSDLQATREIIKSYE